MDGDRWFSHGQFAVKDLKDLAGVEHWTLIVGAGVNSNDTFESLEKLARFSLKTVNILLDPTSSLHAPAWQETLALSTLQTAFNALKPRLLRSWEEISLERMEVKEAASTASDLAHGNLAPRRRAGQLRRA